MECVSNNPISLYLFKVTVVYCFIHRIWILLQNDSMNDENKIRRYINNTKLWFGVPQHCCRGNRSNVCCAVWFGNLLSKFRRNVLPSSSVACFNSRPHNPVEEACTPLQNVGKQLPQLQGATTQNPFLLDTKTGLQLIRFCSPLSSPLGTAATFPLH